MTLQGHITFEQQISVVERKDLFDYFPLTAGHYPNYIRRQVFRVKLQAIMERHYSNPTIVKGYTTEPRSSLGKEIVTRSSDLQNDHSDRQIHHISVASYKSAILSEIESETWFAAPGESDLAKKYYDIQEQYKKKVYAEVGKVAVNVAGNWIGKAGGDWLKNSKRGKKVMRFVHKKGNNAAQWAAGKIDKIKDSKLTKWTAEMYSKNPYKSTFDKIGVFMADKAKKTGDFLLNSHNAGSEQKISIRGISLWEHSTVEYDGIMNYGAEKIVDTIGDCYAPEGIEANINNDVTRGWLKNLGVPDALATTTLNFADFVVDFVPIASATQVVENVFFNGLMAYQVGKDASEFAQAQQRWADLDTKIKVDIKADIGALTDDELIDLYKLLTNNKNKTI